MIRRFQVPEGRELILPVELTEGPHHTGLKGGSIIDIDQARIDKALCGRYIRNRLALGDLVELEYAPTAPEPTPEPAPSAPARAVAAPGTPSDPNPFAKE